MPDGGLSAHAATEDIASLVARVQAGEIALPSRSIRRPGARLWWFAPIALRGTAEGLVGNERRSIPLEFEATGQRGVYRLDQTWPTEGSWIIAISAGDDATMVIELGGDDGGVTRTKYYGQSAAGLSIRSIETKQGALSMRSIDRSLRTLALARE